MSDFDWDAAAIARLRGLWGQGMPTAAIGRAMGTTKSSVVGKAHRLNLPGRPSPLPTGPRATPAKAVRPQPPRLADLVPVARAPAPPVPPVPPVIVRPPAMTSPVLKAEVTAAAGVVVGEVLRFAAERARRSCCFPIGDPRDKRTFRFCDAPAMAGKSYCPAHNAVAYARRVEPFAPPAEGTSMLGRSSINLRGGQP